MLMRVRTTTCAMNTRPFFPPSPSRSIIGKKRPGFETRPEIATRGRGSGEKRQHSWHVQRQEFGSPNEIAAFVINAFHMTTEHAVFVFHLHTFI